MSGSASGPLHPSGSSQQDLENDAPYTGQRWNTSTRDRIPLCDAPFSGAFAVHSDGIPDEQPSRRKQLVCLVLLAAVMAGVVVAVLVLNSEHYSSPAVTSTDSTTAGAASSTEGGCSAAAGTEDSSTPLYSLRFLVVGDWGRQGKENQSEVAELMGTVAENPPAQFIVSTGDNFYQSGLQSASDPLFAESFMDVYTATSLQVPWYAVLGNHDYCDSALHCEHGIPRCKYSPLHQMNLQLSNREFSQRWHLKRSYTQTFTGGKVQLFFIDTSPFIKKYYDKGISWGHCTGGLSTQSWEEQLLLLEGDLAASRADWKIAVGHHPTYSNGHHGNNSELIQHLEPLFQKYKVQAYFAGHDHNLEHLACDGYSVVVTGAGSETGREKVATAYSCYYYPYSGFVVVTVKPDEMVVEFFTLEDEDNPAHVTCIDPSGSLL